MLGLKTIIGSKKNLGQKKFGSINIYLVQKILGLKKTFGKFDNMSLLDLEGDWDLVQRMSKSKPAILPHPYQSSGGGFPNTKLIDANKGAGI